MILVRASVPLPLWIYAPTLGVHGRIIDRSWDEEERQAAEDYAESIAPRLRRDGLMAIGSSVRSIAHKASVQASVIHGTCQSST